MIRAMIDARELVFAVDERDRPVEPVERKLAHGTGVWHRVAHILVYRGDGRVLCAQRSMKKDLSPGKWECIFGGHLAPGQEALAGAVMELGEETGISVSPEEMVEFKVHKYASVDGRNREFQYVYVLRWTGADNELVPEADEVEQLAWRLADEVKKLVTPPTDWVCLGYEAEALEFIKGRLK
jgi:8-oxo-dGTP pyrophosphatase MutT (NUDIX family)